MDILTFLVIIAGGYCVLLFFDLFFKSCAHYPYLKLLDSLGLKISFFTIKWKTKAFNRLIFKWGNANPQFWKIWFLFGVYTSLALLPISVGILFYSVFQAVFKDNNAESTPIITPIIPGVNLPASELGYYSLTLLICSAVHEVGHALASVLEDMGILELGCKVYLIMPVAYVTIPTEKLGTINLKKRLSIFCAGVWHNIFLSFIAYLIYCSLPTIFSPFYDQGLAVSVTHISKNSPLAGPRGLLVNDIITNINDCNVNNEISWFDCLNNKNFLSPAVCIQSDMVHTLDESVPLKHGSSGYVECCDPINNKNLCFEFTDNENNELELPGHVCLPGRVVMEKATDFCTLKPHYCPDKHYCFRAILPNSTFIFKIVCKTKNIIYIGHPYDLYQTIEISSYIKKISFLPVAFPDVITKLIKYIVVISLGLAFVNILPFMFMDGEYIIQILGFLLIRPKLGKKKSVLATTVTTWLFTLVIFLYLVYSVFQVL